MNEPSGYIAIGTRAVYATAFLPATTTAADMAVVLVEPLAEEKRAAYRMLVRLARALAADGLAAIRLDLSGTGDSSLPHAEATLDTWVEDTCAAAEDLLAQTGARRLALVAARARSSPPRPPSASAPNASSSPNPSSAAPTSSTTSSADSPSRT